MMKDATGELARAFPVTGNSRHSVSGMGHVTF